MINLRREQFIRNDDRMADESKQIGEESATEPAASAGESEAASGRETSEIGVQLEQLKDQLQAKEAEAKDNYERFLRQVAELENFKKRTNREKDEAIRFANEYLIKDLLPVIDNLERAVLHAQGGGNGKPLLEGVEMVLKGLLDILGRHGVVPISAMGQPFDPGKHEAMAQVESSEHPQNTVVEEHHKGYLFHDRLLRPALVSVAKAPSKAEEKNSQTEVEKEPTDD
jgi:molecular chaperone GrpE